MNEVLKKIYADAELKQIIKKRGLFKYEIKEALKELRCFNGGNKTITTKNGTEIHSYSNTLDFWCSINGKLSSCSIYVNHNPATISFEIKS